MSYVLFFIAFALLGALKGGQHKHIPGVTKLREGSRAWNRVLDGKVLSTLFAGLLFWALLDFTSGVIAALAWALAVAPSVGEEIGAIGGYRGWWGGYKDRGFTRDYGVKKGLQRGVWCGACFAVAFWNPVVIFASLAFVPAYFAGNSITQKRTGDTAVDWHLGEALFHGILGVGVAAAGGF